MYCSVTDLVMGACYHSQLGAHHLIFRGAGKLGLDEIWWQSFFFFFYSSDACNFFSLTQKLLFSHRISGCFFPLLLFSSMRQKSFFFCVFFFCVFFFYSPQISEGFFLFVCFFKPHQWMKFFFSFSFSFFQKTSMPSPFGYQMVHP